MALETKMGNETFLCKVEFSKYFDLIILQLSRNYLKIFSSIKLCDLQWFWFPILRDDQNGYIVETNRKIATELICQSSESLFSLWRSGAKAPGLVGNGNCL